MFQSNAQIRTIQARDAFLNSINGKSFTGKARICVNGTGTSRRIVKRNLRSIAALLLTTMIGGSPALGDGSDLWTSSARAHRTLVTVINHWSK